MHPTKEVIASWPAPNYVDPITRGPALTVVNIVFIILVFLVVGLRYYARIKISRSFGQDDIVIGLSLVGLVSTFSELRLTIPDPYLCLDCSRSYRRQQLWLGSTFMGSSRRKRSIWLQTMPFSAGSVFLGGHIEQDVNSLLLQKADRSMFATLVC